MKSLAFAVLAIPSAIASLAIVQPVAASAQAPVYADGTYTGPSFSAYYGNVQLQVKITKGQIAGFGLLDYPSHTSTSEAINRQALPMLAQEVLTAQSANVNIISGATLSSEAFIRSIAGALDQASAAVGK